MGLACEMSQTNSTVWCHAVPGGGHTVQTEYKQIPGAVRIRNTTHSLITANTFSHMGGAGLDVFGGSQHTLTSGNYAHDISGTAIQFGGNNECPACPPEHIPCGVNKPGTTKRYSGTTCPTTLPSPTLDLNLSFADNVVAGSYCTHATLIVRPTTL